jgi:hypothetical protein
VDEVAKQQQHQSGKVKILRLYEWMEEVLGQTEDVNIILSEIAEGVEPWIGLLEWVALELAETKDWTSRVESEVAGLRTAMVDGSAKVKEVHREVVSLKAGNLDCRLEAKKDLPKLEQELAKVKQQIRTMKPKPQPIVPTAADAAIMPALNSRTRCPEVFKQQQPTTPKQSFITVDICSREDIATTSPAETTRSCHKKSKSEIFKFPVLFHDSIFIWSGALFED